MTWLPACNRRVRRLAFGFLGSALLVTGGCSAAPAAVQQGPPTPIPSQPGCAAASTAGALCIIVLGDSLGAGVPLTGDDRWSSRLRRKLEAHLPGRTVVVDNWAVSGSRVNVLESAIRDQSEVGTYDIAIVIEGVNDLFDGTVADWRPRYQGAIKALEAKGVTVILGTPPPEHLDGFVTHYDELASAIRSMAGAHRPLLDIAKRWRDDGASAASYYADAIHQNVSGQELMSELALPIVLKVLGIS